MTYNSEGRLTQWSQSLHTVVHAYDGKTNFHLQKTVAGRATTRYLYKSKSKVSMMYDISQYVYK